MPPDFPIQAGPNKRKRSSLTAPSASASKAKQIYAANESDSDESDPPASKRHRSSMTNVTSSLKSDDPDIPESMNPRQTAEVQDEEESSSSEEEDDHSFNEAPPEPMNPEISLDGLRRSAAPTTVHWDPNSADGRLIGMSVRVAAPIGSPFGEWLDGRVILYDPFTHKHKIEWQLPNNNDSSESSPKPTNRLTQSPSTSWIWLRNEEHNLHIATRLVWVGINIQPICVTSFKESCVSTSTVVSDPLSGARKRVSFCKSFVPRKYFVRLQQWLYDRCRFTESFAFPSRLGMLGGPLWFEKRIRKILGFFLLAHLQQQIDR